MVAAATVASLVMPATTLETAYACGFEEHIHTDECYRTTRVLICPLEETEPHTHTFACYGTGEIPDLDRSAAPRTEPGDDILPMPGDGLPERFDEELPSVAVEVEVETVTGEVEQYRAGGFSEEEAAADEADGIVPEEDIPVPEDVIPEETVPEEAVPEETVPAEPAADGIAQNEENPAGTGEEPETIRTDDPVPEEAGAVPAADMPAEDAPGRTVPDPEIPEPFRPVKEPGGRAEPLPLTCGMTAGAMHVHTRECIEWVEKTVCGLEDDPEHEHTETCFERVPVFVCEPKPGEGHVHGELCYREVRELICGKPEHEHTDACRMKLTGDRHADVEIDLDWESSMINAELTGEWPHDLAEIARSQLGYAESERNYITNKYNVRRGWTRYGAWYGDPYEAWNALYAMFCMHYAGIEGLPADKSPARWVSLLREYDEAKAAYMTDAIPDSGSPPDEYACAFTVNAEGEETPARLFFEPGTYTPGPGDLIFLDEDGDGLADVVGIVNARIDPLAAVGERVEGESVLCDRATGERLNPEETAGLRPAAEPPEEGTPQQQDVTVEAVLAEEPAGEESPAGEIPEAAEDPEAPDETAENKSPDPAEDEENRFVPRIEYLLGRINANVHAELIRENSARIVGWFAMPENPDKGISADPKAQGVTITLTAETTDGVVTLTAPAEAFPCPAEELTLRAKEITDPWFDLNFDEDAAVWDESKAMLDETLGRVGRTLRTTRLYDISVLRGDEEIEPLLPVLVELPGNTEEEEPETGRLSVFRMKLGEEAEEIETETNERGRVTFTADFSLWRAARSTPTDEAQ